MLELCRYITSDLILDRIVPYILFMINDSFPQVRAQAIRTISACLAGIDSLPASDANVFPEYVFPQMSHLTQDPVTVVRIAYAENIALISETAARLVNSLIYH
jgi:phosphoinositide-3-kinase regulatory subunit 4